MLRVGVKLPSPTGRIGDYVADVTGLEAAGADAIWLDVGNEASADSWIFLGAIAAVTHQVRLGTTIGSAKDWPPALDTLARLSGGRVVVGIPHGRDLKPRIQLIRNRRADSPPPSILVACDTQAEAEHSALVADGVIVPGGDEVVRGLRGDGPAHREFELWAEVAIPSDRAGWAKLVSAHEVAGATGIIVAWDPRIIDLLRSAGEEDDRTDLLIATG